MIETFDFGYQQESPPIGIVHHSKDAYQILLDPIDSPEYARELFHSYERLLQKVEQALTFEEKNLATVLALPRGGNPGVEVAKVMGYQQTMVIEKGTQKLIRKEADERAMSILHHRRVEELPPLNLERVLLIPESFVKTGSTIAGILGQLLQTVPMNETLKVFVLAPTMKQEGFSKLVSMRDEFSPRGELIILTEHIIPDDGFAEIEHGDAHEQIITGELWTLMRSLLQQRVSQ